MSKDYSIDISQDVGSLAREITIGISGIENAYSVDDPIVVTVAGEPINCFVTGLTQSGDDTGRKTSITALSDEAKIARTSCKKAQTFMSMTHDEYDEFIEPFKVGKTIAHLDYVPRIKVTADDFGIGGWKSNEIVGELASLAGLQIAINNCYSYWVKQFSLEPSRTLLDAILEIVGLFQPIIYMVDNKLCIIDTSSEDDSWVETWVPEKVNKLTQEIVRKETPDQIMVRGTTGKFRLDRHRGYCGNTTLKTFQVSNPDLREHWSSDLGGLNLEWMLYGDPVEKKYSDEQDITPPTSGEKTYKSKTIEVIQNFAKDVFGDEIYLISEYRAEYELGYWVFMQENGNITQASYLPESMKEMIATYMWYENTDYSFSNPREKRKIVASWGWHYTSKTSSEFGLVEYQVTDSLYFEDGRLKYQLVTAYGLCLKRIGKTETLYIPIRNARAEDFTGKGETMEWKALSYHRTIYTETEEDAYLVNTWRKFMDRDGRYSTDTDSQLVKGTGINRETLYRKAPTYSAVGLPVVGSAAEGSVKMDEPSMSLSVNTPCWDDLDEVLKLVTERLDKKEVIRTYGIAKDMMPAIGLAIDMADHTFPGGDVINALATSGIIVGYKYSKGSARAASLDMTVRGYFS